MARKVIPFADIFAGAGGLSVGFELAGFRSVFALDNDPPSCETFKANHPHTAVCEANVEDISANDITSESGVSQLPLLIGGPNCQGVSLRGKRNPTDPKNKMLFHFIRLVRELRPVCFVMENVPGLLHRHNRRLLTDIFCEFHKIGYNCGAEVLLAADYGVPQLRYRFFLIGNREQDPVIFPDATHRVPFKDNGLFSQMDTRPAWLTASDAIADLPGIPNGGGDEITSYPNGNDKGLRKYQKSCRKGAKHLYNHVCHRTADHNIKLIKYIPPGKNWKAIPEALRPSRFKRVALKDHTTTYGRLRWDMPSRTITTYFNNISAGAFTHPTQHRGISVREGARFQSFPDMYRFCGSLARQYRQVGNAVPCMLAFHVARVIRKAITGGHARGMTTHPPALEFDSKSRSLRINRPLQGMRFNLDKHLVRS